MMRNAECGMRNAEWALRNAKRGMRNAEWAWRTPAALLLALGLGPSGLSSQTSLSIYKDGRVVVRQSLAQPLQKGRNAITLKIEGLESEGIAVRRRIPSVASFNPHNIGYLRTKRERTGHLIELEKSTA